MNLNEATARAEVIRPLVEQELARWIKMGTVQSIGVGASGDAFPINAQPVIAVHINAAGKEYDGLATEIARQLDGVIPGDVQLSYIAAR